MDDRVRITLLTMHDIRLPPRRRRDLHFYRFYTAYINISLLAFREKIYVPFSRAQDFPIIEDGANGCPEKSVNNYDYKLRHNPDSADFITNFVICCFQTDGFQYKTLVFF